MFLSGMAPSTRFPGHVKQRFTLDTSIDVSVSDPNSESFTYPDGRKVNPEQTIYQKWAQARPFGTGPNVGTCDIVGHTIEADRLTLDWESKWEAEDATYSVQKFEIIEFTADVRVQIIETTQDWQGSASYQSASVSLAQPIDPARSVLLPLAVSECHNIMAGSYADFGHSWVSPAIIWQLYLASDGASVEIKWRRKTAGSGGNANETDLFLAVLEYKR